MKVISKLAVNSDRLNESINRLAKIGKQTDVVSAASRLRQKTCKRGILSSNGW
jgi:hypothetical protein